MSCDEHQHLPESSKLDSHCLLRPTLLFMLLLQLVDAVPRPGDQSCSRQSSFETVGESSDSDEAIGDGQQRADELRGDIRYDRVQCEATHSCFSCAASAVLTCQTIRVVIHCSSDDRLYDLWCPDLLRGSQPCQRA